MDGTPARRLGTQAQIALLALMASLFMEACSRGALCRVKEKPTFTS
jgi:hypothetical protein